MKELLNNNYYKRWQTRNITWLMKVPNVIKKLYWGCHKLTVDTFHYQDMSWLGINNFQKSKMLKTARSIKAILLWSVWANLLLSHLLFRLSFIHDGKEIVQKSMKLWLTVTFEKRINLLLTTVGNKSHSFWDVTEPVSPKTLSRGKKGAKEETKRRNCLNKSDQCEKKFWDCFLRSLLVKTNKSQREKKEAL